MTARGWARDIGEETATQVRRALRRYAKPQGETPKEDGDGGEDGTNPAGTGASGVSGMSGTSPEGTGASPAVPPEASPDASPEASEPTEPGESAESSS